MSKDETWIRLEKGIRCKKHPTRTKICEYFFKWKGLYNFLNSETLMSEKTVIELPIWEKYLVYATAFGISEKVIKAIEIRCPEIQELTPMLQNNYIRSSSFRSSGRSFSSTARSASYTSRSGGSGYGGGGRGGGGGGGGH